MQVKTIDDYYEQVYAKYPFIPHSDIQRILKYGWRFIYLINSRGGDVIINRHDFWFFMGKMGGNPLTHFFKYFKKLAFKIRTMSIWHKKEYDGYYYFGISKQQYEKIQQSKHTRGRPKTIFNYGNVILYKYLDECKVAQPSKSYIYKIPYPLDVGYTRYRPNFKSKDAILVCQKEPSKFDDIAVYNNKYEFVNASSKYIQRRDDIRQSSSDDT